MHTRTHGRTRTHAHASTHIRTHSLTHTTSTAPLRTLSAHWHQALYWTRMSATKKRVICAQLLRSRSAVKRSDGGASTSRTGYSVLFFWNAAGQTPMRRQALATLIGRKQMLCFVLGPRASRTNRQRLCVPSSSALLSAQQYKTKTTTPQLLGMIRTQEMRFQIRIAPETESSILVTLLASSASSSATSLLVSSFLGAAIPIPASSDVVSNDWSSFRRSTTAHRKPHAKTTPVAPMSSPLIAARGCPPP